MLSPVSRLDIHELFPGKEVHFNVDVTLVPSMFLFANVGAECCFTVWLVWTTVLWRDCQGSFMQAPNAHVFRTNYIDQKAAQLQTE